MSAANEYRISLIEFKGDTVEIGTYWVDETKFAMLRAALGDPEVDSVYSRDTFRSSEKVLPEGAHFVTRNDLDRPPSAG
jgi:hypothetical protein